VTGWISGEYGPGLSHLEHEDSHNPWILLFEADITTAFLTSQIFFNDITPGLSDNTTYYREIQSYTT